MANEEHLNILRQNVEAWNKWRALNRGTQPDLSGTDLSGANLFKANLSKALLIQADLTRADLSEANLSEANLSGASLSEANLSGAILSKADLTGTLLFRADLTGTILSRAILSGTDFTGADFVETDLSEAILSRAILTGASLFHTILSGTDLSEANLTGTTLSRAILTGADFTNATCRSTLFANVDLSDVKGLDTITHAGSSTIGTDTLYKSKGQIPEIFLRGCGLPENLITCLQPLSAGKELKFTPNSIFGIPISDPKRQCDVFMVMPFAETFQPIYEDHVKPITQSLGHTIRRGDNFFGQTSIMTDIWSAINNAKLVIAECTGRNPNVFYELGIAHSLDKPVVMMTQNMDDIPFDIRHLRVIKYEYNPRGMKDFEAKLKTAIENLLNHHGE